jgi:hypothetical protein
VGLFDAFPENPATPDAGSVRSLTDSFETALRTGRPHEITPLRYDIPDGRDPGTYVEKRWVLTTTPVSDGTELLGLMARIEDVTPVDERLLAALREYRDALAEGDLRTAGARARLEATHAFVALAESHAGLAREVGQLQQALRTRPVIEQAKGIVMADRRCSADEAFRLLRKLSMDTNVRLADVAAAMVYQAENPA